MMNVEYGLSFVVLLVEELPFTALIHALTSLMVGVDPIVGAKPQVLNTIVAFLCGFTIVTFTKVTFALSLLCVAVNRNPTIHLDIA